MDKYKEKNLSKAGVDFDDFELIENLSKHGTKYLLSLMTLVKEIQIVKIC